MKPSKKHFNLLVVFEALMNHLSATKAAKQLGVSQAAISESLAKLRIIYKDQLFLRSQAELIPTALALQLIDPVRQIIKDADSIFKLQLDFDPATTRREFTIGMSAYTELLILPHLIEYINKTAPNIKIIVQNKKTSNQLLLAEGKMDISLVTSPVSKPVDFPENLIAQKLLKDKIGSCIGRNQNPLLTKSITKNNFLKANHICMNETDATGLFGITDHILDVENLKRNNILATPHFGYLIYSLLNTNNITLLSDKLAHLLAKTYPLKTVKAPINFDVEIYQIWHPVNKFDPGHCWLRRNIMEIAKNIE